MRNKLLDKNLRIHIPKGQTLQSLGFKSSHRTLLDDTLMVYRFPVYFYKKKIPVIFCEFTGYEDDNTINVNVYGNNEFFAPFYQNSVTGYDEILEVIDKRIRSKMRQLRITTREYHKKKKNNGQKG